MKYFTKETLNKRKDEKPMTKPFHKTQYDKTDHTLFGGLISSSDFNTEYQRKENRYGSPIARQIARDKCFDEQCRRNIENRQNKETRI